MVDMRVGVLVGMSLWIGCAGMLAQNSKPAPTATATAAQADPAAMLAEAKELYRKGSFDLAIARYNEVLKADPQSGEAYAGIVRCYLKQDKVREADDALQKGLQANPGHPDFKVAEGELLFRQGEIPEAGKLFDEVIATPPSPLEPDAKPNARAYFGSARVAEVNAMYAREHIFLNRAHALDPSDPDIRKMWMRTLSKGERIRSTEEYLAQPSNDDADTQRQLKDRLGVLKASQGAPEGLCRPVSDVKGTTTNLVVLQSRSGVIEGSGLDVEVNGKITRLLLDTGSSGILINSKLAAQAGVKTVSDVRMTGVGDKPDFPAHLGYAESIHIGEMEFRNCPVYVVDRLTAADDGLIGADVFSEFLIEIDFPAATLKLSPLPRRPGEGPPKPSLQTSEEESPEAGRSASEAGARTEGPKYFDRDIDPEMHSYMQAFRFGHMLLLPTKINDSTDKLFLLDTGAFDNTISPEVADKFTKVHRAPRLDIKGMSGDVKKVYVADEVRLQFGHLSQTVTNMVAIDMSRVSRQAGTEVSGTLGMVMLKLLKVKLDYRDGLVDLEYKPGKRR